MNEVGVVVGRLTKNHLYDLIINYDGEDKEIRRMLMLWYEDCVKIAGVDDDMAKIGLVVSYPIVKEGRRL